MNFFCCFLQQSGSNIMGSELLSPLEIKVNQNELSYKNIFTKLFLPPQASSHNAPVFLKGVKIKGLVHACMHDLVKIVFFLKRMQSNQVKPLSRSISQIVESFNTFLFFLLYFLGFQKNYLCFYCKETNERYFYFSVG